MFYGAVVWDPWLIVAQIATLQCLYYLTLGLFLSLLVGTRVSRITLLYFFDFATLSPSSLTGWAVIFSFLLASFSGAGFMLYVIERSKKCLDFSATLYIVHLCICTVYGGWPSSLTWWAVNCAGLAVMALLGEYLCIRRELREIPISRLRSSADEHIELSMWLRSPHSPGTTTQLTVHYLLQMFDCGRSVGMEVWGKFCFFIVSIIRGFWSKLPGQFIQNCIDRKKLSILC